MVSFPITLRNKIDKDSNCHLEQYKWIAVGLLVDINGLHIKTSDDALSLVDEYANIRNNPNLDITPRIIKVEALCDCLNDIVTEDLTLSQTHRSIISRSYTDEALENTKAIEEWANGDHDRLVYALDFILYLMQEDDDYEKALSKAFPNTDYGKFYQSAETLLK